MDVQERLGESICMKSGMSKGGVITYPALGGDWRGLLPASVFQERAASARETYERIIKKNSRHRRGRVSGLPPV